MRLRFQILNLLIGINILSGTVITPVWAEILCRRDASISEVGTEMGDLKEKPCDAKFKLQGISYVCTTIEKFSQVQYKHLPTLVERAKSRCTELCKDVGSQCKGKFIAPPECAGYIEKSSALAYGKEAACGKHCEGQAMSYCSLYKAAPLRTDDRSRFVVFKPNCICEE